MSSNTASSKGKSSSSSTSSPASTLNLPNIYEEVIWGQSFRTIKQSTAKKPVKPKHSPINVPFKLCRYRSEPKIKTESKSRTIVIKNNNTTNRSSTLHKTTLLERSAMSQKNYMTLLSVPNKTTTNCVTCPSRKKPSSQQHHHRCCKCEVEPCPPRLIEISQPKKRRVYENWKAYETLLPAETLLRFKEIVTNNGKNLDPKHTRYYFKQIDQRKRKERRKKRKMRLKAERALKAGDKLWVHDRIDELSDQIVKYVREQPFLSTNYQQMLITNEILRKFNDTQKKKRKTDGKVYNATIEEVACKLAKWADTLLTQVDLQAIDSQDALLPIPSAESVFTSESSELIIQSDDQIEEEDEYYEGGQHIDDNSTISGYSDDEHHHDDDDDDDENEFLINKDIMDATELFQHFNLDEDQEEGGETSDIDLLLNQISEDILKKLIEILSNCSDEFLDQLIDNEQMPGVTYKEILRKLQELRDNKLLLDGQSDKSLLERAMIDWAKRNDPDNVDKKILDKIHETSMLLSTWMLNNDGGLRGEIDVNGANEDKDEEVNEKTEGVNETGADKLNHAEEPDSITKLLNQSIIEGLDVTNLDVTDVARSDDNFGDEEPEDILKMLTNEIHELTDDDIGLSLDNPLDKAFTEDDEIWEDTEHDEEVTDTVWDDAEGEEHEEDEIDKILDGQEEDIKSGVVEDQIDQKQSDQAVLTDEEIERLGLGVIRGHKPPAVYDHTPGTVCCLSLKIWAVWLLDITNNAQNWTTWINAIIGQIREYVSIIRGDVTLPNGQKRVLYKEEWRQFTKDTEQKVVAWRQYSAHVRDLTKQITESFHDQKVSCCPKCLHDHLIKDVVSAHETLSALTEAINCAGYWQRSLDEIVQQTAKLTNMGLNEFKEDQMSTTSSQYSSEYAVIEEIYSKAGPSGRQYLSNRPASKRSTVTDDDDSIYEIEEI